MPPIWSTLPKKRDFLRRENSTGSIFADDNITGTIFVDFQSTIILPGKIFVDEYFTSKIIVDENPTGRIFVEFQSTIILPGIIFVDEYYPKVKIRWRTFYR